MGIDKMMINGIFGQTVYPDPIFWGNFTGWMCLVNIISVVISLLIAIFMYKDAKKRDKSGALWGILGFFFSILALIIWLVVRPDMDEVMRKRQQRQYPYGQQPYAQNYNTYGQYGAQQNSYSPQGQYGYPSQQRSQPEQQGYQQTQQTQQQSGQTCPSCGSPMRWVQQYNRWWCDNCRDYK